MEKLAQNRSVAKYKYKIQKVNIEFILEDKVLWESITQEEADKYLSILKEQNGSDKNTYLLTLNIKDYNHTVEPNWGPFSLGIVTLTISWLLGGKLANEELNLKGMIEIQKENQSSIGVQLSFSKNCNIDRGLYDRRLLPTAYSLNEMVNPRIKGRKFGPECWQDVFDSILKDVDVALDGKSI
ncbi:hypothetical protein [Leptospira kmetyi]|uniref:hypothetical protein n=1 Tax=Leptospira kmetyi TaxID=408139 RepID=UPI000F64876A|nr:hypothetical protein [Leptospira kmetyi]